VWMRVEADEPRHEVAKTESVQEPPEHQRARRESNELVR
jgi:hypothetical protein